MGICPEGKTPEELCRLAIEALKGFYRSLQLPTDIRTLIGREPDIDMLVDSLRGNMGDTLGFYVKLSMDDCRQIYTLAL